MFSFSADFYYHFGGYSEKASSYAWFGKIGIQYYSETGSTYYDKMTFFNPRIGKKFFFKENLGLEIDGGVMILLAQDEYYKVPPFLVFDTTFTPGCSVSFFVKFEQK